MNNIVERIRSRQWKALGGNLVVRLVDAAILAAIFAVFLLINSFCEHYLVYQDSPPNFYTVFAYIKGSETFSLFVFYYFFSFIFSLFPIPTFLAFYLVAWQTPNNSYILLGDGYKAAQILNYTFLFCALFFIQTWYFFDSKSCPTKATLGMRLMGLRSICDVTTNDSKSAAKHSSGLSSLNSRMVTSTLLILILGFSAWQIFYSYTYVSIDKFWAQMLLSIHGSDSKEYLTALAKTVRNDEIRLSMKLPSTAEFEEIKAGVLKLLESNEYLKLENFDLEIIWLIDRTAILSDFQTEEKLHKAYIKYITQNGVSSVDQSFDNFFESPYRTIFTVGQTSYGMLSENPEPAVSWIRFSEFYQRSEDPHQMNKALESLIKACEIEAGGDCENCKSSARQHITFSLAMFLDKTLDDAVEQSQQGLALKYSLIAEKYLTIQNLQYGSSSNYDCMQNNLLRIAYLCCKRGNVKAAKFFFDKIGKGDAHHKPDAFDHYSDHKQHADTFNRLWQSNPHEARLKLLSKYFNVPLQKRNSKPQRAGNCMVDYR